MTRSDASWQFYVLCVDMFDRSLTVSNYTVRHNYRTDPLALNGIT